MAIVFLASSAVAQTTPAQPTPAQTTPPADPLAIKPIPSDTPAVEADVLRAKVEQAGYTEVSDLARDTSGLWQARHREEGRRRPRHRGRQGRPHQSDASLNFSRHHT